MSDHDLVMRWVRGWAAIRSMPINQVDGWPLVRVNGALRDTEIVCVDPGRATFEQLAEHPAREQREMLTVFGHDLAEYHVPPLPPGLRVERNDEVFMTSTLTAAAAPLPHGYSPRWIIDGLRARYVLEADESIAAEGSVGVIGQDAVFDVIETSPGHRRRGLARHVMGELTSWAIDHQASTGLLAASADGAGLYTSLGWETRLRMWSLMSARP